MAASMVGVAQLLWCGGRRRADGVAFGPFVLTIGEEHWRYEELVRWGVESNGVRFYFLDDPSPRCVRSANPARLGRRVARAVARRMVATGQWRYAAALARINDSRRLGHPKRHLRLVACRGARDSGSECAICFEVLGAAFAQLNCGHSFHAVCAKRWHAAQPAGRECCCLCRAPH